MTIPQRPTPDEVKALREAFPEGAPRVDYRDMLVEIRAPGDAPTDTFRIAISSEAPVLRYDWWTDEEYWEVLDHSPRSVDRSYLDDGMPLVMSHNARDGNAQHGIVENVTVDKDRVMRGDVRFSKAPRSQEIAQDMRDGIRKKVSVGYIVGDEYTQTEKAADGIPIRRYTSWMPIETSTVPIPADYSVGVGRDLSPTYQSALQRFLTLHPARARAAVSPSHEETRMSTVVEPAAGTPAPAPVVDTKAVIAQIRGEEADKIKQIRDIANLAGLSSAQAEDMVRQGVTVEQAFEVGRKAVDERMKRPNPTVGVEMPKDSKRRFSVARAIIAQSNDLEKEAQGWRNEDGKPIDLGFERELLQEAQQKRFAGSGGKGSIMPYNVLGSLDFHEGRAFESDVYQFSARADRLRDAMQRTGIDSATSTTGQAFKFTQAGEFIPLLRNKTSVMRAGATVLSGLTGPVSFPKQTATGAVAWSAENPGSDPSRTDWTTSTVSLSFKSVTRNTAFSRQVLFSAASGNYAIDALIMDDLARTIALAIDAAALNGLGTSNQPLGLLQNTNIGSVTIGAAGGAMTYAKWVDLETKIGDANAETARMAYITNTKQRGTAKKTAVLDNTASGVPVWQGPSGDQLFDGVVNGYRAIASNQVPRNLTKGSSTTVCSAILFGAFEHLLVGLWGPGVETIVDPYSLKNQGMVEVAIWAYMDAASRYDTAFAAVQDAT